MVFSFNYVAPDRMALVLPHPADATRTGRHGRARLRIMVQRNRTGSAAIRGPVTGSASKGRTREAGPDNTPRSPQPVGYPDRFPARRGRVSR
jgi:hypothetical protein